MLYDLSHSAAKRGDMHVARNLSIRAKSLSAETAAMRREMVASMSLPFERKQSGEEHRIDLHGIVVEDAISIVRAHVKHARKALQSFGLSSSLKIITGKGIHSGGHPKVYLAVVSELKSLGIKFSDNFEQGNVVIHFA